MKYDTIQMYSRTSIQKQVAYPEYLSSSQDVSVHVCYIKFGR